ncbi:MAG TPA: S53 family peptidase [Rhodanobacteraceae bacterium]
MNTRCALLSWSIAAALACLPVLASAALSNPALAGLSTNATLRVTQAVNNLVVSQVPDTHLSMLDNVAPTGTVSDSTPMNHMQLILRPSARRVAELAALIVAQHNPASPKFHQWLTPREFGAAFGVAGADIAAVQSWLMSEGFTVNGVYPNQSQIDFSGTAGMVHRAFHTQEYRYTLDGQTHMANGGNISVPTALQSVIVGVAGLNNFHPQAQHTPPRVAKFDASTGLFKAGLPNTVNALAVTGKPVLKPAPMINFVGGVRGLVPYDMQTIYNTMPLYQRGITGKGITIAVVEDQDMDVSDWGNFVQQFGLGKYGGTFRQFQPQLTPSTGNCTDPGGATPAGETLETVLDSEYATAMAPSAHIWVATCNDAGSSNFFGGVFTAADNLINGNDRPNIISASYGFGEDFTDAASKTAIDMMWAQADAEGISVFVSSGDSGSNPSFNGSIINGVAAISANSLATSPNDTAVGGTDLADVLDGTTKQYFSSTLNAVYGSALSYVPEITWNQSCANTRADFKLYDASALTVCKNALTFDPEGMEVTSEAGSGGPSSVDRKPWWQRIVRGAANDKLRDVPDVSLFAGSYGGYTWAVMCTGAYPCTPNFTSPVELVGGTSLASPMFAGIQALMDQGLSYGFGRRRRYVDQGNAAPALYELASFEYGGPHRHGSEQCNANNGTRGTAHCVFHDVTGGGNSTECVDVQEFDETTPDCFYYGESQNFEGQYGPTLIGLTSTSSSHYDRRASAFPAHEGWSFANGLGSVNASNLLSAWQLLNLVTGDASR